VTTIWTADRLLKSKCVTAINILNNNCLTFPDKPKGINKYNTHMFPVAPNTIFHSPKHKSPSFQIILLITKPSSSSSSSLPFALTTGNPTSVFLSYLPHDQMHPKKITEFFTIYRSIILWHLFPYCLSYFSKGTVYTWTSNFQACTGFRK
jgi:hypothetical protein